MLIDTIDMDFIKAFDKVPHKRLITKLESYELSNQTIKWVDSFLMKGTKRSRLTETNLVTDR